MSQGTRLLSALCILFCLAFPPRQQAGQLPDGHWELLVIGFPPDRTVAVYLGGAEKTLTAKGIFELKWREKDATMEIQIENLPPPAEIGWTGQQYVLWAVGPDKRAVNLGLVPLSKKGAKWKLQIPVRVFGLLVTAEKTPNSQTPSQAVVLESLLPSDRYLVIPVTRINVPLAPQG